jgi:hypothetical protein
MQNILSGGKIKANKVKGFKCTVFLVSTTLILRTIFFWNAKLRRGRLKYSGISREGTPSSLRGW